jgi:hypothetical protein
MNADHKLTMNLPQWQTLNTYIEFADATLWINQLVSVRAPSFQGHQQTTLSDLHCANVSKHNIHTS